MISLFRNLILLTLFIHISTNDANAIKLSDYEPYEFDVRFTNPVCDNYLYTSKVYSNSGELLLQKPKNAYCSNTLPTFYDGKRNWNRDGSPSEKLSEWINDPNTKEVFFAFLSFSNGYFKNELCRAMEKNGLKITARFDTADKAEDLIRCWEERAQDKAPRPDIETVDAYGIGYQHNKIFIANPTNKSNQTIKIAFGSGNASSGMYTHHENWNFITTNTNSYFAKAHLCLMDAMNDALDSKDVYAEYLAECRYKIEVEPEEDITIYFIPAIKHDEFDNWVKDGDLASNKIINKIKDPNVSKIYFNAHRFSHSGIVRALKGRLSSNYIPVNGVVDDDIYWLLKTKTKLGDNGENEAYNIDSFIDRGADVKFMQTNHDEHQLHHNKIFLFEGKTKEASGVFTGAPNFTETGFDWSSNYDPNTENAYWITIPEVVEAYRNGIKYLWDLATSWDNMPSKNVTPVNESEFEFIKEKLFETEKEEPEFKKKEQSPEGDEFF